MNTYNLQRFVEALATVRENPNDYPPYRHPKEDTTLLAKTLTFIGQKNINNAWLVSFAEYLEVDTGHYLVEVASILLNTFLPGGSTSFIKLVRDLSFEKKIDRVTEAQKEAVATYNKAKEKGLLTNVDLTVEETFVNFYMAARLGLEYPLTLESFTKFVISK